MIELTEKKWMAPLKGIQCQDVTIDRAIELAEELDPEDIDRLKSLKARGWTFIHVGEILGNKS